MIQLNDDSISLRSGVIRQPTGFGHTLNGSRRYSIAMVAACPFPANHGSAASIREMSDTLSAMGHDVHIVTYATGQEDITVRHAKIHRISPYRPETNARVGPSPGKFLRDFQLLRLLCRVIKREGVDLIHAHNYEGALVGVAAKWATGRPLLYNAVNLMADELAGYRFIRPAWLAKAVARALDWFIPIFPNHITAVSPELKEWFVEHGIPEHKVDMVPAGIEPGMFDNVAPVEFAGMEKLKGRPVVIYTGVLNAFQRIDYLLRAFATVLKDESKAFLLILSPLVSEAHERENKKLADALGLSHSILWVAPHTLDQLPGYLALADVAVVSRPECPGHPVKLLNYMLASKATVCFAGAAKGVRHLHDAFIVPDHDYEALGQGIITLLKDPALAMKLGTNARTTVITNFDWRKICLKIERIYKKLVSAPPETGYSQAESATPAIPES